LQLVTTMPQTFISYRRSDSADMSRRLYNALVQKTNLNKVFRDVDKLVKG